MKKIFIILILSAFCGMALSAQAQDNCYFPTKKGAELSYKYYNKRGKPLKNQWDDVRWMRFVVEEVWPQDNGVIINVAIENETIERFAKNERLKEVAENLSYGDVKVEGNRVTLDNIQWLADVTPINFLFMFRNANSNEGSKYNLDLSAQTCFPRRMDVGDSLPNENILDAKYAELLTEEEIAERDTRKKDYEMAIASRTGARLVGRLGGRSFLEATAQTQNRKVEAFEKVTTPAGTFDCYKITYELVTPPEFNFNAGLGMDSNAPQPMIHMYADWMSPEVGLVKREKYNDRGNVQEYMQLDSYKK